MTAIPQRRQRRTIAAIAASVVLVMLASTIFTAGVVTLSNSQEGEAVGIDDRPRVALPDTPNAVLAVADPEGRLASLVVMTLVPEGKGGSIVTIPVNADSTAGFGMQRRPLFELFEASAVESIVAPLEDMLTITIERAAVVGVDALEELLAPIDSLSVTLPEDIVDATAPDAEPLAVAGPQTLSRAAVAEILATVDEDGDSYGHHDVDVEIWTRLARTAPSSSTTSNLEVDEFGRPVPPDTAFDLIERLWQGDVAVRDLAVSVPPASENSTGADVVILDRVDAVLVFAQISPALVSTPNQALSVRVVVGLSADQLATSGGLFESSAELAKVLIGELLFFQSNVISVDTATTPGGASAITRIELADERFVADMETAAPILFGPSEVVVASTILEGVDMVVTLGTGYIDRKRQRAAESAPASPPTTGRDVGDGSDGDTVEPDA
jgi:hypothetical protein